MVCIIRCIFPTGPTVIRYELGFTSPAPKGDVMVRLLILLLVMKVRSSNISLDTDYSV